MINNYVDPVEDVDELDPVEETRSIGRVESDRWCKHMPLHMLVISMLLILLPYPYHIDHVTNIP